MLKIEVDDQIKLIRHYIDNQLFHVVDNLDETFNIWIFKSKWKVDDQETDDLNTKVLFEECIEFLNTFYE